MKAHTSLVGMTVAEAFVAVVENDADLQNQRARAIEAGGSPVTKGFYYGGSGTVLHVTYGHDQDSPIGTLKTPTSADELVRIANHAFGSLFSQFIALFASGQLIAEGLSKVGSIDAVPRSLWSNDRIMLDFRRGDLLEFESKERLGVVLPKPIFRGLMIRSGSGGFDYPKADTNAEVLIRDACVVLWPTGIPGGFPVKSRNNKVNDYIKSQGGKPLSAKSYERYFNKT